MTRFTDLPKDMIRVISEPFTNNELLSFALTSKNQMDTLSELLITRKKEHEIKQQKEIEVLSKFSRKPHMVNLEQTQISEQKLKANMNAVLGDNGIIIGYIHRRNSQYWSGTVYFDKAFKNTNICNPDIDNILSLLMNTHEKNMFQYISVFAYWSNYTLDWHHNHVCDNGVENYTTKEMVINEVKFVAYLLKKYHTQLLKAVSELQTK